MHDEFAANYRFMHEYHESLIICLTETWLECKDSNGSFSVDGYTLFQADRMNTGKKSGGGACAYVNYRWANNMTIKDSCCSEDTEFTVLQSRPFYLLCELNNV